MIIHENDLLKSITPIHKFDFKLVRPSSKSETTQKTIKRLNRV